MTRAALLVVGMLTLAACSSGSDAEPPPPLDTEAPTTTIEPPPTDAPTTTAADTTTTAAETTTTVTTETPPTEPPISTDQEVVESINAVVDEAFVDYEATWLLVRAAFEAPNDEEIRAELSKRYASGSGQSVFDGLNALADDNQRALAPEPGDPQRVILVRAISGIEDTFAVFQTCETFSTDIVDSSTGETTYEGVDSTLREVQMMLEEETWLVLETVTVETYVGPTCE